MTPESAPNLEQLNTLLAEMGLATLEEDVEARFGVYLELLVRWNERMNLTALRSRGEIRRRHFVECIGCAQGLPQGIGDLLAIGSGAGFPGVPIAICRPEIRVTLAESQAKKAAFLNEVLRTLGLKAEVFAGRAESMRRSFDCVTLRAVDRMNFAVKAAAGLLKPNGWLAVMTTQAAVTGVMSAVGEGLRWREPTVLPGSEQRILLLGLRTQGR